MNNVLEMLNEAHSKKNEKIQAEEIEQIRTPSNNQPSLMRQSSLQNLKIKSFFNFGHKWKPIYWYYILLMNSILILLLFIRNMEYLLPLKYV